jgi:dipeptidyl aminopeptidase/acylaminoacyl peptidase
LARNGFVVFKIDLRGHGSSEGEPGGGYYSSDYVIDGLSARAALASSDFVDPDRIGFWGHSMAGNVVMRVLAARPEIPAVVMWAGAGYTYQDLREIGIDDNSYQPPPSDSARQRKRRELFASHGQFDLNSEFWKQVVPTNYLSDIRGAIQLDHAVDDNVVSIEYSRNLDKVLDATSIPHELNELPSGGHNITGSSFTTAMQKTVEFFKVYLK